MPDFSKQSLVLATPKILRARNMVEFRAIEVEPGGVADRIDAVRPRPIACWSRSNTRRFGGQTPQIKVDLLNAQG